mgnify:CR=1 FL=1
MDLYFRDANASGTITLDKFAGAVVSKLDGNASALPPIGAVSAIDHNDAPPADHKCHADLTTTLQSNQPGYHAMSRRQKAHPKTGYGIEDNKLALQSGNRQRVGMDCFKWQDGFLNDFT